MDIKLDGIEEIIEYFENIEKADGMKQAVKNACALVEREAKMKAPKDSGDLRRSIESRVEDRENNIIGTIFSPLEYAPYVEYGTGLFAEKGGRKTPWAYEDEQTGETIFTRGQKPHPYLRPALLENEKEIRRILKEGAIND